MAVGNIIGSNVFNILAVMGIPGLLHPSILNEFIMGRDFWVMLAVSILLVVTCLGKSRSINRIEGGFLLACFIAYQAYLLVNLSL
jgi:cation:H+ antiporter